MIPKLNSSAKQALMISQFLWVRNLGMAMLGVSASSCLLRMRSFFHRLDCSSLKPSLRGFASRLPHVIWQASEVRLPAHLQGPLHRTTSRCSSWLPPEPAR